MFLGKNLSDHLHASEHLRNMIRGSRDKLYLFLLEYLSLFLLEAAQIYEYT